MNVPRVRTVFKASQMNDYGGRRRWICRMLCKLNAANDTILVERSHRPDSTVSLWCCLVLRKLAVWSHIAACASASVSNTAETALLVGGRTLGTVLARIAFAVVVHRLAVRAEMIPGSIRAGSRIASCCVIKAGAHADVPIAVAKRATLRIKLWVSRRGLVKAGNLQGTRTFVERMHPT